MSFDEIIMNTFLEMTAAICASDRDTRLALVCLPVLISALGLFCYGWAAA
jgi:hypothetical protein